MNLVYLKILLFACFTGLMPCILHAQVQQSDTFFLKKVLPVIEARWEQPGGDTAIYFILQQVQNYCGEDENCLIASYSSLVRKLERRAFLPLAIFVGEKLAKAYQQQGYQLELAQTYKDIFRFHDALGNDKLAIANLERALPILEQLGDRSNMIPVKMSLLEYSLHSRPITEVLPEMELLLARVVENRDTFMINYLRIRLVQIMQEAGLYDQLEPHIEALERVPLSDPIQPKEYPIAIFSALGRADLFRIQKKWVEAERQYQKVLRLCEAEPSRWVEIQVLQTLSDLEWERKNAALAKSYLEKAQGKAEKLSFNDLLADNYERKARIAEAEGRFGDALAFVKKQQFHKEKFKAPSAGFNVENYYLQREKEQLATEKKNQELELRIRKTQLQTTLVITALVLLSAVLAFAGFRRQRKGKQELAAQNTLIQQQAEELKSLDMAKSRFFANVSHELRTPLTLVLGPVQSALKSGTLDPRNTRLLETARQNGADLLKLVGSLLDLSKLEHGKMVLKESPEPVFPLMQRIISTFESHAAFLGIQLKFFIQAKEDLQLMLDREKLETILNNLLSNAFKFTDKGGNVEVRVADENDTILISVTDTGRGIAPGDLPRVFERFYQSKDKNAPAEGGTGIGLALCRELTALMGGSIRVESKPGNGSTFFVELPKKVVSGERSTETAPDSGKGTADLHTTGSESTPDKTASLPSTTSSTDRPTILVVEDNYSLQDYLHTILSPHFRVEQARNGREALEVLGDGTALPSLILSDLMMPVMDGFQLLENLKGKDATRHIPAIMLTARADVRDRLKALRIGVDDYLTKPFDEEELLVRIENLLQHRTARQELVAASAMENELSSTILSAADIAWLEQFEAFVRKNLAKDTLSIPTLSHEFAMSESTLLRQLKRLTGLSTVQYLQEMRLDEARRLLEIRSSDSIAQIASKVGYEEVRSFSRIFKQRFGKLPSEFASA